MTESPTVAAALAPVDAVVFELDGVVLDTAELRAAAWRRLVGDVFNDPRLPPRTRRDPLTDADYTAFIEGRTSADGIAAFLASRGVRLPPGSPADGPGDWTAFGLGKRQDELFGQLLRGQPPKAFPSTLALLERLRAGRIPVLLATSASKDRKSTRLNSS